MATLPARASLRDGRTLWRGVIGLAKAWGRVDAVDDATRQARRSACAKCPEASAVRRVGSLNVLTATSTCGVCRCNLRAKTRLQGEDCPIGRW